MNSISTSNSKGKNTFLMKNYVNSLGWNFWKHLLKVKHTIMSQIKKIWINTKEI